MRCYRERGASGLVSRRRVRRPNNAIAAEVRGRAVLRGHLDGHGRPVAVYSDRHGVFRVNHREREGELTQFGRALRTLDIEPIHAGSPQAKGRVERANGTLQDRLVKEMRLRGIDGMEAGNAFLPEFMEDHNQRFAGEPPVSVETARCPSVCLGQACRLSFVLSAIRVFSSVLRRSWQRGGRTGRSKADGVRHDWPKRINLAPSSAEAVA